MAVPGTSRIGRFEIVRLLGQGLQGKVYLALDPKLRRKVALKLVLDTVSPQDAGDAVPSEALHLAELRHPNIVSVYEFGEHGRIPYLVCEFVEGATLRERLASDGALPLHRSLPLLKGVLEGMAHAHSKGILHLDLSPSNLMVDTDGVPRVMDFGLSRKNRLRLAPGAELAGALAYMSPEHLRGRTLDARTDVYALGLIGYELLAHRRAKAGNERSALIRATVMCDYDFSPIVEADPAGQLAAWVRTATQREPDQRFANAGAMLEALNACQAARATTQGGGGKGEHAAIEYLLFRIRRKSELPALSRALVEINRMTAPEAQTPVAKLANAILLDYALTNKVLKLASSSFYGGAGRNVKNVSDAIRVLGMGAVRQACTALLALRQFGDAGSNGELVDSLSGSFIAGLLARHLAPLASVKDREQAFICGLFQGIGRSLAIYHFPREHEEAKALVASGTSWPEAQVELFGVTYQELGRSVARTWGFPETILVSMAPWNSATASRPESEADGLFHVATFANRLCGVFVDPRREAWEGRLARLSETYADSLGLAPGAIAETMDGAIGKFRELAPIIGLPLREGGYVGSIAAWLEERKEAAETAA
ncbi:MAG: HDOD domain-containing protein [Burkholderiales bacterium]|nr:HDOD domain-containing protein [Burkholderiales bacterium]